MKHLLPQPPGRPAMNALERNVGGGSMAGNHLIVVDAAVAFVSGYFSYVEVCSRGVHEVRKELRITGILLADFNRRHHVRFHTAHQMDLDPGMLLPHDAVFMIHPPDKATGGESRILLPIKTWGFGTEYIVADTEGGQPCNDGNGMRKPKR